jgi:hypothetical protein
MAIRGKTIIKNAQTEFPSTNRKEEIIDWLETNGYEKISDNGFPSPAVIISIGKKCYMLGKYKSKETSWIMFCGGQKKSNVYFVRTVPGTENLLNMDGNAVMIHGDKSVYSTFKEIKEMVDNGE